MRAWNQKLHVSMAGISFENRILTMLKFMSNGSSQLHCSKIDNVAQQVLLKNQIINTN